MFYRGLTLNEILDYLNDDSKDCDVYIEPPDHRDVTDEDSAGEGEESVPNIGHLSGNQLLAPAELRSQIRDTDHPMEIPAAEDNSSIETDSKRKKRVNEQRSSNVEDNVPIESGPKKKKPVKKQRSIIWEKKVMTSSSPLFPERNSAKFSNLSFVELFELFFDDNFLIYVKQQMTTYCLKNNWSDVNVSVKELKVFLAILIVSGYAPLPQKPLFWSKQTDVQNVAVSNAMRRNRFDTIMKCLHFNAGDDLDKSDKFAKIRPLISHLQVKFMEHFVTSKNISHDEAMVQYFGKHGCKQAIRNKPIRFGYKVWCQNDTSGYLIAFDPYQGKTHRGNVEIEERFGKCAGTILHLIDMYSEDKKNLPYHFYFDNLFTTLPLLQELNNNGYHATGTMRANRLGSDCPLPSIAVIDKKDRGHCVSVTAKMEASKIVVTRWKDNAVVTVASTVDGDEPLGTVRRWSKKDINHVLIPIPKSIQNYNKYMGGTDQMDQNVNNYRIGIRGKKWWWCLFTWFVDVAVQNAWQLARLRGTNIDQLSFRREIAMSYLLRFQEPATGYGKKNMDAHGAMDARYDNVGHHVRFVPDKKRRRCQGLHCSSHTRTECKKCDVGLCIDCFANFHEK